MSDSTYSTAEVAYITGFSIRQLSYWADRELIVPSAQRSCGPGTRKRYSLDDLVRLQVVRQLKHFGWSTQKIGQAVATLRLVMDDPDPMRNAILVHGKNTILALCKTKEGERILLDSLHPGGQQVMPIILETLQEEVRIAVRAPHGVHV